MAPRIHGGDHRNKKKKRAGPSRTALSCVVRDPGLWGHEFTLLCCRGSLSHDCRAGVPDLPRITAATTPARSAALRWLARARMYLPAPESAPWLEPRFLLQS